MNLLLKSGTTESLVEVKIRNLKCKQLVCLYIVFSSTTVTSLDSDKGN
jgi:hypothetical protein